VTAQTGPARFLAVTLGIADRAAPHGCLRSFSFNLVRVPSVTINGQRESICRDCVIRANPMRRANGLPEILPLPDAYEACNKSELQ